MRLFVWAVGLVLLGAPAQAEWARASSEHFLIYSEQKPNDLRKFAEDLERFDGAVRAVRGMADLPLSKGNRITIFALRKSADVQRLINDKSGFIDGFYRGQASGSVAFVSREGEGSGRLGAYTILFHEYGILDPQASAVVPMLVELSNGVRADAAEALAQKVRAVESSARGNELVETTLAGAELTANHAEAAEAAAGRALELNPKNPDALVLKGRAIAERAGQAQNKTRTLLFDEARRTFIAANAIDKEDPEPLYEFYRTFVDEGVRPNANAIAALHYASDLAPQDLGLRMDSAIAYLNDGKPKEARATLTVVAYSPHGGNMDKIAQRMIAAIDSGDAKAALAQLRDAPSEGAKQN